MFKETIVCIIIIVLIFGLDMYTQNFTNKSVEEVTEELSELKEIITQKDEDKIEDKLKELEKKWEEKHDKLAYYIEHDELEKVDTAFVELRSYVNTKDYSFATAQLEQGKFILEHIEEKTAFNLTNIF